MKLTYDPSMKPGQRCWIGYTGSDRDSHIHCYSRNAEKFWSDHHSPHWRCKYVHQPQTTGERAATWLRQVADRLIEKSKSYGDSIGDPVRIFSKSAKDEGIRVRIDDKLSRIAKGTGWSGDNDLGDLVGYLALLAVAEEVKPND